MKPRTTTLAAAAILVIAQFCLACQPRLLAPCAIPPHLTSEMLIGTWKVSYRDYVSPDLPTASRIRGEETVVLGDNGLYTQQFAFPAHSYVGPTAGWSVALDAPAGPRVVLQDFRYFAHGAEQAESPVLLGPQMVDLLRYKEAGTSDPHVFVEYPDQGLAYLYPRICNGRLVLMQMVAGMRDPDDLAPHHPMFEPVPTR